WQGTCIVHETFSEKKIIELQLRHPDAELIAHPECEERILKMAHFVASTSGLLRHVATSPKRSFIVATEEGILHQMHRAAPGKTLIPAPPFADCSCNTCPHMKRNTLEKLYLCLRDLAPAIEVPEDVRVEARRSIDRMLEMTAGMVLTPVGSRS
ncbi:MAG: quinolinate synthase NadA, partial [Thermoanaerobaculia bacterium]